MHQRFEFAEHIDLRHVTGDREHVLEAARIQECHLRATLGRRLAQTMRQHRDFMTQIRTHDEDALEAFDLGNLQSQMRIGCLILLRAEIQLPQAMIDIPAA